MPKTEEYYKKLGEFVVKFNVLDTRISFWLWVMINAGESDKDAQTFGRRITSLLEYNQKIELLDRLIVDNFSQDVSKKFKPIKKDLITLGTLRNTYVHGEWLINIGKIEKKEGVTVETSETLILHDKKAFDRGGKVNYAKAVHWIDMNKLKESIKLTEDLTTKLLWLYKFLGLDKGQE